MSALGQAKVGDKLRIDTGRNSSYVDTVAKVGKVHVTTERGSKYIVRDGCLSGDRKTWFRTSARLMSDEDVVKYELAERKRRLIFLLSEADWKRHSIETLETVLDLVK